MECDARQSRECVAALDQYCPKDIAGLPQGTAKYIGDKPLDSKIIISIQGIVGGGIKVVNQEIEGVKIFPKGSQVLKDGREVAYRLRAPYAEGEPAASASPGNRRLILNPPPCGCITRKAVRC